MGKTTVRTATGGEGVVEGVVEREREREEEEEEEEGNENDDVRRLKQGDQAREQALRAYRGIVS